MAKAGLRGALVDGRRGPPLASTGKTTLNSSHGIGRGARPGWRQPGRGPATVTRLALGLEAEQALQLRAAAACSTPSVESASGATTATAETGLRRRRGRASPGLPTHDLQLELRVAVAHPRGGRLPRARVLGSLSWDPHPASTADRVGVVLARRPGKAFRRAADLNRCFGPRGTLSGLAANDNSG